MKSFIHKIFALFAVILSASICAANTTATKQTAPTPQKAEATTPAKATTPAPKPKAPSTVQTILTHSKAMKKNVPVVVVLPDSYFKDNKTRYPVIYLLHGFGGNHRTWISVRPDLQKIASRYDIIFACPDGATSWYWDSPKNPALKYETYVAKELVSQIDKKYRTIKSPKGRAITGLSMGGHGGLWLAFRHQDIFGACGATSGGVDIRPFPKNWRMAESLGNKDSNQEIWEKHTVINQTHLLKPNKLAIIIDCGTEDFFYKVNEALHQDLLEKKIPHDYITRPGKHNSPYWKNSIMYQIMFFDSFFHDANFLWTRQGAPKKN